jgi:stage V sporulation protein SpoVS
MRGTLKTSVLSYTQSSVYVWGSPWTRDGAKCEIQAISETYTNSALQSCGVTHLWVAMVTPAGWDFVRLPQSLQS